MRNESAEAQNLLETEIRDLKNQLNKWQSHCCDLQNKIDVLRTENINLSEEIEQLEQDNDCDDLHLMEVAHDLIVDLGLAPKEEDGPWRCAGPDWRVRLATSLRRTGHAS